MDDNATPAKVRLTDGLGPLPPKTALGWDYGYTDQQMREYAAGEVARATSTMNACLLQMQEAAKDLAAKATVLEPYRKPYARDSFEAWASDAYKWPNAIERSGDGYRLMQTQSSWEAWSMAWGSAEAVCAERLRKAEERCSAWADIAGAHGAQVDRLRALLREVSANRWECATEDGACPDCGADDGEPHDSGCLLGRVDAEIETAAPLRKSPRGGAGAEARLSAPEPECELAPHVWRQPVAGRHIRPALDGADDERQAQQLHRRGGH